ncbi:hypothetical protein Tco_0864141 [Tanacetum coccineum]
MFWTIHDSLSVLEVGMECRFGEEVMIFCLRGRSLCCLFVKGAYGCILGSVWMHPSLLKSLPELFELVMEGAYGCILGTLFRSVQCSFDRIYKDKLGVLIDVNTRYGMIDALGY